MPRNRIGRINGNRGAAAAANPSLIDALPARQQANDAAFGPVGRYPFQACFGTNPDPAKYYEVACNRFGPRGAVRRFTDAIGWYPGFEYRPDLDPDDPLFFRDVDASVVVPSKGNQIYSTRVTDKTAASCAASSVPSSVTATSRGPATRATGSRRATTERPPITRTCRSA